MYLLSSVILFNFISSIWIIISLSFKPAFSAAPFESTSTIYIPFSIFKLESKYGITSLSYAKIPKLASSNLPSFWKLSIIGFTIFIGIANPIPSADVILIELTPITFPLTSINGPPLFPRIYCSICLN